MGEGEEKTPVVSSPASRGQGCGWPSTISRGRRVVAWGGQGERRRARGAVAAPRTGARACSALVAARLGRKGREGEEGVGGAHLAAAGLMGP
jgi:hypothetical protein